MFEERSYGSVGMVSLTVGVVPMEVVPMVVPIDMGVVPMDWRGACIVPLYKGKGDKCECSNSRGLLSVVGKLYGIEC